METVKKQFTVVTTNFIGGAVGGAAFYFGAKKWMNVNNNWVLGGLTILGVIAGANAQAKLMAPKAVAPKK